MEYRILLNSVEDAVYFINTLEHYDYHAEARFETGILDARSLLGILGYGVGKVITLMLYDQPNDDFCYLMKKYATA